MVEKRYISIDQIRNIATAVTTRKLGYSQKGANLEGTRIWAIGGPKHKGFLDSWRLQIKGSIVDGLASGNSIRYYDHSIDVPLASQDALQK